MDSKLGGVTIGIEGDTRYVAVVCALLSMFWLRDNENGMMNDEEEEEEG